MLQNIRNNVQGTMAKGIIILITIPFILTGAETLLSSGGSSKVAKVNGAEITQQQLDEEVFLLKRRLVSQLGDDVDPAMLDDKRLRSPALEGLIERTLLEQSASKQGMIVADKEINRMIMQTEEFQEDGRFSKDRYAALLSSTGLTPAIYKRLYKNDVLRGQYISGVSATDFLTEQELEAQTQILYQQRDIKYLRIKSDELLGSTSVTEEEALAFYQQNPNLFVQEERVVVDYIELKQSDFEVDISEQELKEAYEHELANQTQQVQRQVSHILIEANVDKASEIYGEIQEKLSAGSSFADLAAEYSDDIGSQSQGGFLGELQVDIYPESFVAAAEGLQEGEISNLVKTDAGYHIIRVDQLVDNKVKSFDERKEALAKELKQARANPLFWAAVEQLKDSSFNAPDLEQPAAELQVEVKQSGVITRQGGEGIFAKQSLVQLAFSEEVLRGGFNSDVVELDAETVLVLRLNEHQPESVLEFEQVKSLAQERLKHEKVAQQLHEQALELQEALQAGADIEALASEHKLEWQLMPKATREHALGSVAEIVNFAFNMPAVKDGLLVEQQALSNGDVAVVVLSNVKAGKAESLVGEEKQMVARYMGQASGALSFELLQQQLANNAKIKRY